MPITMKQKIRRRDYIGSSDVAAIMGLSPWRTAYDVWLEKTGKLEEEKSNEAAEVGNAFEHGILSLAEPLLGKLLFNQFRVLAGTKLASNLDAIIKETGCPVEAKLRRFAADWGEPHTDQVPDDVLIQAQVQLLCTRTDICHIAAVLAERGFRLQLFFAPADRAIGQIIIDTVDNFWRHHIQADVRPEESLPSTSVIKRIRRQPNSLIDIAEEVVVRREEAKESLNGAQEKFDVADLELKTALGTAEAGRFDGGLVTYFTQHRKAYQVAESDFRVLRIKRDKEKQNDRAEQSTSTANCGTKTASSKLINDSAGL